MATTAAKLSRLSGVLPKEWLAAENGPGSISRHLRRHSKEQN